MLVVWHSLFVALFLLAFRWCVREGSFGKVLTGPVGSEGPGVEELGSQG